MTQLLTHTVAHFTRPSFRSKKVFKCLAVTWVKVVKMCKILTFKVNFLHQKVSESFQKNFHWRISIYEQLFCYWHFLTTSISKTLYLLKWCPSFDNSLLHQFKKYNNFLLVYWFLCKNLSNFVSLLWKLNNRNNTNQCWNLYSTSGPGNSAMAARDTEVTSISLK